MWQKRNFFFKEIEQAYADSHRPFTQALKTWLLTKPEDVDADEFRDAVTAEQYRSCADNATQTIKEIAGLLFGRLFRRAETHQFYCSFPKVYHYVKHHIFLPEEVKKLDLIMFHCPLLVCAFSFLAKVSEEYTKACVDPYGSNGLSLVINYMKMQVYDHILTLAEPIFKYLESGEHDITSLLRSTMKLDAALQFIERHSTGRNVHHLLYNPLRNVRTKMAGEERGIWN